MLGADRAGLTSPADASDALVIGAGPAGLMAAETLARAGLSITLAEAMPTAGRKLLMAGKSGLNLTRDEPPDAFAAAFAATGRGGFLAPVLAGFGPAEAMDWARRLGQPVFTGSSGRVFPVAMKASPLLRAWIARLSSAGVVLRTRWRWHGWAQGTCRFVTPEGEVAIEPRVTVLALGGASWARLGSDGAWAPVLRAAGVEVAPFLPSNMGFDVAWSPAMARHFGAPVKAVRLDVGGRATAGEFVLTARGIEGGAVYAVSQALRDAGPGAVLTLDLAPDRSLADVAARLAAPRGGDTLGNHLRKRLRLAPVKIALLREAAPGALGDAARLANAIKALPLRVGLPRPLDEAISTAGGVTARALDAGLMLRARPGVFCAGEMLDWDAPTGGYLITGCLATGRHAGLAAAAWTRR